MFTPLTRRLTAAASIATLTAAVVLPRPATAQDLPAAVQQVTPDAQLVVLIPNLQGLSEKIATFSRSIGVPAPQTQDVLGQFKQQMGMNQGINDSGALMMVVSNLGEALQTGVEPNYAMLVPVSDFQAFVANFQGQDMGDGLTELAMPGGRPGYAKQLGDYAVISPNMQAVEGYAAEGGAAASIAQKVGQVGQRYLAEGDISIFLDMGTLGEQLKPMLDAQMDQMVAMAEMMGGQGGMQAQNMRNLAAMYALLGDALVDSTGLVKSISLSGDAASINFALNGKADSAFTKLLPGGEAQTQPMLASMPAQPFIFAGAVDPSVMNVSAMLENFTQALEADDPMTNLYKQMQPMLDRIDGYGMAFYAPTDPMAVMSGGLMRVVNVYQVDDADAFKQQVKQYLQDFDGMSQPMEGLMPDAQGNVPAISWTTQWTDTEMQLDGVDIDSYQVQTNFPPELMNQMGQMGPMIAALGGTGYSGLVAAKDGHVVMTTVRDAQLMSSALQTLGGDAGLSKGDLLSVDRNQVLPPSPFAEGYLSISGLGQTLSQFLPMLGAQPIQVPGDLPPVAMGAGLTGNTLAMKLHVPARSVKFIVETAQQMQMQAQQQGGGGFGPQPAPY